MSEYPTCPMDGSRLTEHGRRALDDDGGHCYVITYVCAEGDEVDATFHYKPCPTAIRNDGTIRLSITFEDEESQVAARDALIEALEPKPEAVPHANPRHTNHPAPHHGDPI